MKEYIKHIVEDFDFNSVNQINTAADRVADSLHSILKVTVDLGLPSHILWCKYNLGCDFEKLNIYPKTSKPEDWYGDFYKWGATEPTTDKNRIEHEPETSKQLPPQNANGTPKYDGSKLRYSSLESCDDAAHLKLHNDGLRFFIPQIKHYEELLEHTTNKTVTNYQDIEGLNGVEFTSKLNGNTIFFPSTGWYSNNYQNPEKTQEGITFHVWTSNLDFNDEKHNFAYSFTNALSWQGRVVQVGTHLITNEIPIRAIGVS